MTLHYRPLPDDLTTRQLSERLPWALGERVACGMATDRYGGMVEEGHRWTSSLSRVTCEACREAGVSPRNRGNRARGREMDDSGDSGPNPRPATESEAHRATESAELEAPKGVAPPESDGLGVWGRLWDATPRPGYILCDRERKLPSWPGMPRCAALKRERGRSLPWEEYQRAGALATAEEAAVWEARGGLVGLPLSAVGLPLAVLDVDSGDAAPVIDELQPLHHHPTRRAGGVHIWTRAPFRRPDGNWERHGARGEVRHSGFVVLWRPDAPLRALAVAVRKASPAGDFPDWALPEVTLPRPVPERPLRGGGTGRARFLDRVLERSCRAIDEAARGVAGAGRHDTLRSRARTLAGYHASSGARDWDDRAARSGLVEAFVAVAGPGRLREAKRTVMDGWESGMDQPIEPRGGWR